MMRPEIPDSLPVAISGTKSPRPTQTPASNSNARKRDEESRKQTADATFSDVDPHTDWGLGPEMVREALAQAWSEGFLAGSAPGWRPGRDVNPYEEKAS